MKRHARSLLYTLALLSTAVTAQTAAPLPNMPTGQVGGIPVTAVQQQGGQQFLMPISLDLLPYGTVTLSEGRYLISNYEGRGIDIYIFSPQPLRIATYAEMMVFQAQFGQMMQAVAQGSPVPVYTTQNPPLPTTLAARPAPAPTPPVQAAAPVTPAGPQLPAAAQSAPAPPTLSPVMAGPVRNNTVLPDFLTGFFNGRVTDAGLVISYSLHNRSGDLTARIDPQNILIQQGNEYLAARLTARDSSGQPGIVPPRSAQIGTISIPLTNPAPVTVRWTVQNIKTGELYPMTYTYAPTRLP